MGFTTGIIRKTYKAKVSSGRHVDQSLTFPWRGMPEPGHPARFTVAERSLLKVTLESILEDWGRVTVDCMSARLSGFYMPVNFSVYRSFLRKITG